jgi:hypothetical protein
MLVCLFSLKMARGLFVWHVWFIFEPKKIYHNFIMNEFTIRKWLTSVTVVRWIDRYSFCH